MTFNSSKESNIEFPKNRALYSLSRQIYRQASTSNVVLSYQRRSRLFVTFTFQHAQQRGKDIRKWQRSVRSSSLQMSTVTIKLREPVHDEKRPLATMLICPFERPSFLPLQISVDQNANEWKPHSRRGSSSSTLTSVQSHTDMQQTRRMTRFYHISSN